MKYYSWGGFQYYCQPGQGNYGVPSSPFSSSPGLRHPEAVSYLAPVLLVLSVIPDAADPKSS
jgi:hypothetical protein